MGKYLHGYPRGRRLLMFHSSFKKITLTLVSLGLLLSDSMVACLFADDATELPPAGSTMPGPIVLYEFNDSEGDVITENVKKIPEIDLVIADRDSVEWISGGLRIRSSTEISTKNSSPLLTETLKQTNEISVEVWLETMSLDQAGPARLISLSSDPSHRNFTLGQDEDRFDFRLRTSRRDRNGLPSTSSPRGNLSQTLTHVLITRDRSGETTIYQDGQVVMQAVVPGDFRNWDSAYRLSLANEVGGGRPWVGSLYRLAIYDVCIEQSDVSALFEAGSEGSSQMTNEQIASARIRRAFTHKVAPLLASHCLECHDAALHQGGLDLSSRAGWQRGGESGDLLNLDHLDESLLLRRVSSDEMPHDRPPLRTEEKEILRQWLADGAIWPIETIDPAVYRHQNLSGEVWVQRLTVAEYVATVKASLGVDVEKEALELLPPDVRADGFSNTAYNMGVDLKHVEAYRKLSEIIVSRLDVLDFSSRFSKSRKLSTDATMREQVEKIGHWLLRSSISEAELNDYCGIATTVASAGGDFELAIGCVLEAMLQSPRFLYRIEFQKGNGATRRVHSRELATRMSYILWGASPDKELMRAADAGELWEVQGLESQVDRMLNDQRAIERSKHFVGDWLNLGRLKDLRPDAKRFPDWNANLALQMRHETLDFFVEVIWRQGRPVSDLLNAQVTILDRELAEFYGLDANLVEGPKPYDLTGNPHRGGLLTQASVLTLGGDDASMVSRGLFVLDDLLRGVVNAPPPCVNTTPPQTAFGLTQRAIAESRIKDATCGVCHARFEPLAFGLERFDGIGAYHEVDEHGNELRDDGEVLFPGQSQPVQYESVSELMDLLANSERVKRSLTWKVVQFSLGRPLTVDEAGIVDRVHDEAQEEGGGYRVLMKSLIKSDLVQRSPTEVSQ